MADELSIRLSITGDTQVDSALRTIMDRLTQVQQKTEGAGAANEKANNTIKQTSSSLKGMGQLFNQTGAIIAQFGQYQVAGLINKLEGSFGAARQLNQELEKTKLASFALGAGAFGTGFAIGDFIRARIPYFNEADKLEEGIKASLKAKDIALQIIAIKDTEKAADTAALQRIDQQITEIEKLKSGWFSILGIKYELSKAQENELLQLRRLREATVEDQKKRNDLKTEAAFQYGYGIQTQNQMNGTPEERLRALQRQEADRLEALVSSPQFKEQDRLIKERQQQQSGGEDGMQAGASADQLNLKEEAYRQYYANLAKISGQWYDEERARKERDLQFHRMIEQQKLEATQSVLSNLAVVAQAFGKKGFAAFKAIRIAEAIVATYAGASRALIDYPWPYSIAVAAATVAAGIANVATIAATKPAGYMEGGFTGSGPRNEVAGQVHRGEFVWSAPAVESVGLGNLQAMHDSAVSGVGVKSAGSGGNVNVAFISSAAERREWLRKDPEVRKILIDLVTGAKQEIGLA